MSGHPGAEALLRGGKVLLLVCWVCARGYHELHVGRRCCKGTVCQPCGHHVPLTVTLLLETWLQGHQHGCVPPPAFKNGSQGVTRPQQSRNWCWRGWISSVVLTEGKSSLKTLQTLSSNWIWSQPYSYIQPLFCSSPTSVESVFIKLPLKDNFIESQTFHTWQWFLIPSGLADRRFPACGLSL